MPQHVVAQRPDVVGRHERNAVPGNASAIAACCRPRWHSVLLGKCSVPPPDDIRTLRYDVLRHPIRLGFQAVADDVAVETIIDAIFAAVPTP